MEVTVDATFPEPLLASEQYCESGGNDDATCTCWRQKSGETFQCSLGSDEPSCCFDESHYDSTFRVRETLELRRCDGSGNLADSGG